MPERADPAGEGVHSVAVVVEAEQPLGGDLGHAVERVRAGPGLCGEEVGARGAPDRVVGRGVDEPAYVVRDRGVEERCCRHDVRGQGVGQRALARVAREVDDRVEPLLRQHRPDGVGVGAVDDVPGPVVALRGRHQVQPHHLVSAVGEADHQHPSDAAGGAGDQDPHWGPGHESMGAVSMPDGHRDQVADEGLGVELVPARGRAVAGPGPVGGGAQDERGHERHPLQPQLVAHRRHPLLQQTVGVVAAGAGERGDHVGVQRVRVVLDELREDDQVAPPLPAQVTELDGRADERGHHRGQVLVGQLPGDREQLPLPGRQQVDVLIQYGDEHALARTEVVVHRTPVALAGLAGDLQQ